MILPASPYVGKYFTIRSIKRSIPTLCVALPENTGRISPLRTPRRTPRVNSASENSSPLKYFSINSSSLIAIASAIWFLYSATIASISSGTACAFSGSAKGPSKYHALSLKILTEPIVLPFSIIGTSNGITALPKVSRNSLYALSKDVFSSSSLFTKKIVGSFFACAPSHALIVPGCTAFFASTTINALSPTDNPASLPRIKSMYPGVSIKLILQSFHSIGTRLA